MFPETKRTIESDCPVCYAAHDEDIHEATMRLRGWFHYQVTHRLQEEEFFDSANGLLEARVA
jgi:hypothetical protein